MLDEKKTAAADPLDGGECVPLQKIVSGSGTAPPGEGESAAAPPLLFRGAPICWEVSQQTRRVVEKNAFGPDTISERPGRKSNLIVYNGQTYQKEQFYKAVF